jgi:hypothetical protein
MAKRVQRIKRATSASTTKKKPTKKATTRSQVQAKKKAAAKKATPKKAPVKKATAKRNVGKDVRAAERKARAAIGEKAFNMQERVADRNEKALKSKPAPKTPAKKGAAKGAVTRKQNQFKKAAGQAATAARKGAKSDAVRPTQRAKSSVKPAATASGRKAQVGRLLKQGMKRAGILGLGFAAADFAGLTPELTSRDARMGRRTKQVQKEAAEKKANTPKVKGLKKETVKPKKKPVNIGNVSKKAAPAKKPMAKKAVPNSKWVNPDAVPKNVVRSSSGAPVRTGSGGYLRTNDYENMTQEEIDRLFD